ncbi:MAG: flavodoxin domain-containing protein [Candidatus Kapaibacterium sp.]
MAVQISKHVKYVGKIDWELRKFHGDQMSTDRGSSYNSYLVQSEKTALIDSVWKPYIGEFLNNLKNETNPGNIDYVIANHAEPDHSGVYPHLLAAHPDLPVYCSANGAKSLKGYYHKDWNFKIVKTGDKLSLGGGLELTFIEAPMMHWPDTLMCHLSGDDILFSNDVFGQHLASEFLFAEMVNKYELDYENMKYYANIIWPFAKKAKAKLEELRSMKLPIQMIAPAHGVIWREGLEELIAKYEAWSDEYAEDKITVLYDTMYESTRKMAEAIASGIRKQSPSTEVKLFHCGKTNQSDVITEVFRSKGLMIGSPAYNNGVLNSIGALMEELKGISPAGKKAGVFTSYGWSPRSLKQLTGMAEESGMEVFGKGLKVQWNPDEEAIKECIEFGEDFAASF